VKRKIRFFAALRMTDIAGWARNGGGEGDVRRAEGGRDARDSVPYS
jgi:hypothetical protein